jgi:hypothetical protein
MGMTIDIHMHATLKPFSLDRIVSAVEKVRERLLRAVAALEKNGISYAVAGGNAVAAWVSRVDEAAVRFTQDVDILIRRSDLNATIESLEKAGSLYGHVGTLDIFLDVPHTKTRDAVHIIVAGEKVREHEPVANPDIKRTCAI